MLPVLVTLSVLTAKACSLKLFMYMWSGLLRKKCMIRIVMARDKYQIRLSKALSIYHVVQNGLNLEQVMNQAELEIESSLNV